MRRQWYQLEGIDEIEEKERFERRLAKLAAMTPEQKRRHFAKLGYNADARKKKHDQDNVDIEEVRRLELEWKMEEDE